MDLDDLLGAFDGMLQEELDYRSEKLSQRLNVTGLENIKADALLRELVRRWGVHPRFEVR